jgi:hypothetical protein
MPVQVKKINDMWRLVEFIEERFVIAKNRGGSPIDGGGHRMRNRAMAQMKAVNTSLEKKK